VQRGRHSVGAMVRDAAAYVLWSLARAIHPHVLRPYIAHIASILTITAICDRALNVRRACAAAFQVSVGV
jgi:hypothetical protein